MPQVRYQLCLQLIQVGTGIQSSAPWPEGPSPPSSVQPHCFSKSNMRPGEALDVPHCTPLPRSRARTAGKSPVDSTSLTIRNNQEVSPTESTRTAGGRAGVGSSLGGCVVTSVQAAQTSGTWLRCLTSSCGKSGGCPAPALTAFFVLTWHHRWVLTCPRCQQPQHTDPVAAGLTRPVCAREPAQRTAPWHFWQRALTQLGPFCPKGSCDVRNGSVVSI